MRLIALIIPIILGAVGFFRIVKRVNELNVKKEFAEEFLSRLKQYVESRGEDGLTYAWLTHRSPKMQSNLGMIGIAQGFRPPYASYMIKNYQIIVNNLPELRRSFENRLFERQAHEYAVTIQETILRYIGILDDQLESEKKSLKNPIIWFREGVQVVLLLPLLILHWVGLLTSSAVSGLSDSLIFKLLVGLVTILGLLSSLVTIVLGWDQFVKIAQQIF